MPFRVLKLKIEYLANANVRFSFHFRSVTSPARYVLTVDRTAMLRQKFCFRLSKQISFLQACRRLPLSLGYHYHTETDIYGNTAHKSHLREESKFCELWSGESGGQTSVTVSVTVAITGSYCIS